VLVTGATGFLGRYLVAELASRDYEVVVLVHKRGLPENLRKQISEIVEGDLRDTDLLRQTVARVDAVCHLAAYLPTDFEDPSSAEACLQINSLATLNLAQAALARPGCRFVHLSSSNAYAFTEGVATEESLLYPADRATYYLASKMVGELYVEHLRRVARLQSICFRISSTYGWGMTEKSVVARFMASARQSDPLQVWDGGIPTYDFVYVTNVVQLVAAALKHGQPGVYNVGSGVAHSILELARAVADTYPEGKISIEVKPPLGAIPAGFSALSINKAARMWGYRPLSLRAGLAELRQRMEEGSL